MFQDSARAVRDAVKSRLESGREMAEHNDHPILAFQHLIWHEGYHHAQIKLAQVATRESIPAGPPRRGLVTGD